jgi:co-chaperonin GroES (HSP10)
MIADIEATRPYADNVLVLFNRARMTAGGILIPDTVEKRVTEAIEATVIAAGPGHDNGRAFFPMDPDIRPGARVLVESKQDGDRLYSDEMLEYRMVRAHNIIGVLDGE